MPWSGTWICAVAASLIPALLGGCATQSTNEARGPWATYKSDQSIDRVRDCLIRSIEPGIGMPSVSPYDGGFRIGVPLNLSGDFIQLKPTADGGTKIEDYGLMGKDEVRLVDGGFADCPAALR